MRRFVARTALFLAGLAGLFALASAYYEIRVRQAEDFFRQVAWFRDPAIRPAVLLIGDSRLALNVDPQRLPPGFYNFSYPGETLRHFYLRAKFALREKPSIRYLVIGLEDLTLAEARARLREVGRQMVFAGLADLMEVYPPSPRFLVRSAVLHYLPLVNTTERARTAEALTNDLRRLLTGQEPGRKTELLCGGFRFAEQRRWVDFRREERKTQAAKKVGELFGETDDTPEMRAVFRKILDLAERHGVKVIGVRSPLSRDYLAALSAAALYDTAATRAFFGRSPLHAMLDYETLFAAHPAYFFDSDHLNGKGAARFTDRLVADLRQWVTVDADASAPCEVQASGDAPRWPYNAVLAQAIEAFACHRQGDCDGLQGPPGRGLEHAADPATGDRGLPADPAMRPSPTSAPRAQPRRHGQPTPASAPRAGTS